MHKKLILEKGGTFAKQIFSYTDENGKKYIIKESVGDGYGEFKAFQLMKHLGLSEYFVKCVSCTHLGRKTAITLEYVPNGIDSMLKIIPACELVQFWNIILIQLADLIDSLEGYKIQHNDFTPSNVRIALDSTGKYKIKVIDLETMVDYACGRICPHQVVNATPQESKRMGWSKSFHVGADMNQMLGELFLLYSDWMPKIMVKTLSAHLISKKEEFPYAIAGSNMRTSGAAIKRVLPIWPTE